ncbi:hypothetical protein BOX15_Mlig028917g1 [Macrostomum lignano]|uniref:EF-hand domain-containing protein n=1 Tax=Macrostomum lignano TaxID=282301 RepID=A0A267GRI0_9PLAT|nr:hypothetical protein BOX15_Mlig028917g1 [Macrostomum lignano]
MAAVSAVPEQYYAALQEAGVSVEEASKHYLVFKMFDKDNSDTMDAGELFACLQVMGQAPKSKEEVEELLKLYDKDASGSMNFVEFSQLMGQVCKPPQAVRDDLMASFQKLDKDNSGYIERDELHDAIFGSGNSALTEKEFDKLMREADANGDGKIDYSEFLSTLMTDITKMIETKKQKVHDKGSGGGDGDKKKGGHGHKQRSHSRGSRGSRSRSSSRGSHRSRHSKSS